jgi:hypothetical protein
VLVGVIVAVGVCEISNEIVTDGVGVIVSVGVGVTVFVGVVVGVAVGHGILNVQVLLKSAKNKE